MSQQKSVISIFKPKNQRLALEPRIVFDAAMPFAIADYTETSSDNEQHQTVAVSRDQQSSSDFLKIFFRPHPRH